MGFLDVAIENAQEMRTMPDGEYRLRCGSVDEKVGNTSGKPYLNVRLEMVDETSAEDIYYILSIPTEGDDEKAANRKKLALKRFFEAFQVSLTPPINLDAPVGHVAYALVTTESDAEYGDKNKVKRFTRSA